MEEKVRFADKKNKMKLGVVVSAIVLLVILIISVVNIVNRNAVISELNNDAVQQGLKDYKISVKGKNSSGDYKVIIECNELDNLEYKEIYQIVYKVYSSDAEVTFISNGDRYKKGLYKLYKNGETVYNAKSSSSSHSCIECGSNATRSYKSPFSGETEWYCSSCYRKLQDLLDQFGMN